MVTRHALEEESTESARAAAATVAAEAALAVAPARRMVQVLVLGGVVAVELSWLALLVAFAARAL
jgi:hypothetical protein